MSTCGIYRIEIGPYFYLGSSVAIEKRRSVHRGTLERRRHHNVKMQAVFDKYQEFNFKIVATCAKQDLRAVEQQHIDAVIHDQRCMNIKKEVDHNPGGWNAKRMQWNGCMHASLVDAVASSKYCIASVRKYMAQGCTSDGDIELRKHAELIRREEAKQPKWKGPRYCELKVYYNGRWWSSYKELTANSEFSWTYLSKALQRGYQSDEEAAAMRYKVRKPMVKWERPAMVRNPVLVIQADGSELVYHSTKAAVKAHALCRKTVRKNVLKHGWYSPRDITILPLTKQEYHERQAKRAV
jgi:hypothetical protein